MNKVDLDLTGHRPSAYHTLNIPGEGGSCGHRVILGQKVTSRQGLSPCQHMQLPGRKTFRAQERRVYDQDPVKRSDTRWVLCSYGKQQEKTTFQLPAGLACHSTKLVIPKGQASLLGQECCSEESCTQYHQKAVFQ